jgi:hypothetical protein
VCQKIVNFLICNRCTCIIWAWKIIKSNLHRNILHIPTEYIGPGYLSRYSDSLQVGLSWDRIPVRAKFSAPVQTIPGVHSSFYRIGTGFFPGEKRPKHGVDHPTPSIDNVKDRIELYLWSSSVPSWPVIGWPLPFPFQKNKGIAGDSECCMKWKMF